VRFSKKKREGEGGKRKPKGERAYRLSKRRKGVGK